MHQSVVSNSSEVSLATAVAFSDEAISPKIAASTETNIEPNLRISCLEAKLADQLLKIYALRGLMFLALSLYGIFFLLGPVMDFLPPHNLPEMTVYRYLLMLEGPCVCLFFMWLLSSMLPEGYAEARIKRIPTR